jgi:hypothetical protein
LFAFSWYEGKSTVSLLDIADGKSYWQYSTPNGHNNFNNRIRFKDINTTTDMIIASSG